MFHRRSRVVSHIVLSSRTTKLNIFHNPPFTKAQIYLPSSHNSHPRSQTNQTTTATTTMSSPNQPTPLPSQGGEGDPLDSNPIQQAEEIGRLQSMFQDKSFHDHPSAWDTLWNESYTPWDRGGPSLALKDLLEEHRDLFPHFESQDNLDGKRPRALVPGCGRGHDVLLLSRLGYDAYGLDFSEKAMEEAKMNEQLLAREEEEYGKEDKSRLEPGRVTWVAGDFFDPEVLDKKTGLENSKFDLVFDYTFFCALPPQARAKWSSRIQSLLKPKEGRLVCLEWPLHKHPKTGGPPWGVTPQAYLAHLNFPGREFEYDGENNLALGDDLAKELESGAVKDHGGMERIARIRPSRTHKAGYDPDGNMIDFISVWRVRNPGATSS